MSPTRETILHPAGYNAAGQKLTLTGERKDNGTVEYCLRQEARRFNEQPQLLAGLTAENIRALAKAVEGDAR